MGALNAEGLPGARHQPPAHTHAAENDIENDLPFSINVKPQNLYLLPGPLVAHGGPYPVGHPMQFGKRIAAHIRRAFDDMKAAGIGTDPDTDAATERLRERLKVPDPVSASTQVTFDSAVGSKVRQRVLDEIQRAFDMVPARSAKRMKGIEVRVIRDLDRAAA